MKSINTCLNEKLNINSKSKVSNNYNEIEEWLYNPKHKTLTIIDFINWLEFKDYINNTTDEYDEDEFIFYNEEKKLGIYFWADYDDKLSDFLNEETYNIIDEKEFKKLIN